MIRLELSYFIGSIMAVYAGLACLWWIRRNIDHMSGLFVIAFFVIAAFAIWLAAHWMSRFYP